MSPALQSLAARQLLPNIEPPPGVDPMEFFLNLPALTAPEGADTTMTLTDMCQAWYVVTAVTCIAIPGMFLMLRIYTKVAIVKSFDITDCECE
jgi:hypothetical protein